MNAEASSLGALTDDVNALEPLFMVACAITLSIGVELTNPASLTIVSLQTISFIFHVSHALFYDVTHHCNDLQGVVNTSLEP
jgi:hypothetical protein